MSKSRRKSTAKTLRKRAKRTSGALRRALLKAADLLWKVAAPG